MTRCAVLRAVSAMCVLALLGACATAPVAPTATAAQSAPVTAGVAADLAPSGTLRAAINFGNPILAVKDPATGEPRGVSVDLARELGRRVNVPVTLVLYESAGNVVAGQKSGAWDIAFLAVDPARAAELYFTAPYVVIEGAYLVPERSTIRANAEVDRAGIRVVVGAGSAYDLFRSRELQQATLVRAPTSPAVTDMLVAQNLDVAAGVKQQLEADAKRVPGVRLLPGRFMVINQAVAAPRGRAAAAGYLDAFVEDMKATGFVERSLARHGISGATIAPAAVR
jgi:polar amino acid transport system substrate-binding protein